VTGLPRSLPDVTPEWLTGVLRKSASLGAARVTSVQSVPVGGGLGLMSQVTRLSLRYSDPVVEGPTALILKLPPEDAGAQEVGLELGFFEREARFYQDLAPRTAIRAPRCYFSHYDPAGGAFVTLLEDLSGARLGDIDGGCSAKDGIAAMRALSSLHASWWNNDELAALPWLPVRRAWLEATVAMIGESWAVFVERFGHDLDDEQLRILASVHGLLASPPEILFRGPQTLLHGDFKLDNLFFYERGEVTTFDWGLAMSGPAAYDVAFFIGLDLDPAERRLHEDELIGAYLAGLSAAGVGDYGYDKCIADYCVQLVSILPQLIDAGGQAVFADEAARRRYATSLRRVLATIDDHHALAYFT
jgi:Phosphotransferase enzyme family